MTKLRRVRLAKHVERMREMTNPHIILVGKFGGKKSFRTLRLR
jgi:hypothetical protein